MTTIAPLTNDRLRQLERDSIRQFLTAHAGLLTGRVLDYGCGQAPYRDIIEPAAALYSGYDRAGLPGNTSGTDVGDDGPLNRDWDAIVSTQTVQYVKPWYLADWLAGLRSGLEVRRGVLLMTGPTCWPLVEPVDICRYTPAGMAALLADVGFETISVERRAPFVAGEDVRLCAGWQAVAWTA